MKRVKQIVMMAFASLLAQCVWAAPVQIWNGDFAKDAPDLNAVTQIKKSAGGVTYTLNLNGNKVKRGEDGRTYLEITNSDALSLGISVSRSSNSSGGTMLLKYSNLSYTGSDAYAVVGALSCTLSGGYDNINGVQIADSSRTIKGFWADGYWDTHANGMADVDDTIPEEGCFALSYKDENNTATSVFKSTGDGSWTKIYQNGGKGSNTYSIRGFSIGGLYGALERSNRDTNHSTAGFHTGARPATGMKIHAVAFAAEGISAATGLSSFIFGETESRDGDADVSYLTINAPTKAPAVEVTAEGTAFGNNSTYERKVNGATAHSVKVTGATGNAYSIYGGRGENDCGTLNSDIWLNVVGGTFRSIYGGSNGNKWSGGSSQHVNGSIVVEVGGNTTADYVFGGSFKDGYVQNYYGNIDVVVKDSAVVKGTIAGGGFSTHNKTTTYNGNVNVLVKNVQNDNTATKINKTNTQGFIIGGGIFDTNANGQQNIVGNATVTIDIENGSGTFGKTIVGGGLINGATDGYGQAKVSGNTAVNINAPGVRFTAPIYAGALKNGNNGSVSVGGTATITVNGGVFTDKAGNNANFYGGTATGAKKLVLNCDEELYFSQINGFDSLENNANFAFYVTAADPRTFETPITGAGSLTKKGAGTLILSGINTYTGNTTISAGAVKATTKNALGSGTVTVANGAALTVPASDETPYTLGGGSVTISITPEQQAGQMPLVTGIKAAEGAELTLAVVDATGATVDTLEATIENGVVVINAVVEFKDATWDSENSQWIDGNGNVVEMGNNCNVTLKDGDSVTFSATPNSITLPDSGAVTISSHQTLGATLINVPENTTLVLPTSGYNANLKFAGTGTIQIGGTNTATKHNLYNGWLRNSNLESFTGTIHMIAGRFETQTEAIRSDITIKVTNGSQLSTGSTGTWNNHFILSGNGWTGESGAFNTVPLRLGCTLGESAIVDMVREETDTVEPGISVHSQDLTIGATITGTCGMRLIGGTAQTLTFSKPQNCTLTGTVTVNNLNLRFSNADGTSLGMSAGQTIHFGDTIMLSAGRYLELHPWTTGVHTTSTSDKVTIDCDITLADGSYITVDDGSYVFSGNVSVLDNATAKFTPNWRKGWVFTNLNVPASATFSVEQNQHNDSNSSVLAITGGTVAGTLNLKGTAADRPVLTSLTSSVVTGAKAVNLKGGVTVDLGDARSLTTHIVAAEGVSTLKVACEGSSAVVSSGDSAANPFIKIADGATLTLNYNNFSGWNGAVADGWIVNEGTLKIQSQGGSGFFRNHLVLTDGHDVSMENTSGSAMLVYGGASSAEAAQIQLASGTAEISGIENAKGICIGNSFNDGDYGLENGSKAVGVNVGDSATLTISALVTKGRTDAQTGTLTKWGNGALVLSNSANTFDGTVTLKAGTIQSATTLNVTTDVEGMEVVGDGSEATPYALQLKTFTVTAPTGTGLTVSSESVTGNYGDTVTITYTLAENYILKSGDLSQSFTYSASAQAATLPTVVLAAAKIGDTLYETIAAAIAHIADGEIVYISGDVPADYKIVDGKVVAKVYVAQVGANKYETLDEAMTAAGEDGTVTLLDTTIAAPTGYAKVTTGDVVTLRKIGGKVYYKSGDWTDGCTVYADSSKTSTTTFNVADTMVFTAAASVYPDHGMTSALKIEVAANTTVNIGHEGTGDWTNLPSGSTIELGDGAEVVFQYWGNEAIQGTAKLGDITINGANGTYSYNSARTNPPTFGAVTGTAKLVLGEGQSVTVTSIETTPISGVEHKHIVTTSVEGGTQYSLAWDTYTVNLKTFDNTSCLVKVNDGKEFTFTETFTVNHGDKVVFHYEANEGYEITAGSGEFKYSSVTQDITPTTGTINVTVAKLTYTITITPVEHTAVTVDGEAYAESTVTVEYGDDVTIAYVPATNYKLVGTGTFELTNVTADQTVGTGLTAVLDVTTITIPPVENMTAAVVDGDGQTIAMTGNTITVAIGSTFTVTYTPNEGYVGEVITLDTITAAADTVVTAPTEGLPVKAVAKIGTTLVSAADFRTSVNAIVGDETVQLLADIDLAAASLTIKADANVTLDLNGKTLTSAASQTISITGAGAITIKDTAEGGKLTNTNAKSSGKVISGSNGSVTLESGTLEATAAAISAKTVNISGGSVSAGSGVAVAGSGTITGGTITSTGSCAVSADKSGLAMEITGGTITGVASKGDVSVYTGNVKVVGVELANGIKFASNAYGLVLVGTDTALIPDEADVEVYNGETLEGYYFSASSNGLYTTTVGKVCKLVKDVAHQITIAANTTLDLNGHNITVTDKDTAILMKAGSSASAVRTATITGEGTVSCNNGSGCNAVQVQRYADVTIAGGNYVVAEDKADTATPDNATIYIVNSYKTAPTKVTITGGTFEAKGSGKYTLNILDSLLTGLSDGEIPTITVSGGTFVKFDPAANNDATVADGYESVKDGNNYRIQVKLMPEEPTVDEKGDLVIPTPTGAATVEVSVEGEKISDGKIPLTDTGLYTVTAKDSNGIVVSESQIGVVVTTKKTGTEENKPTVAVAVPFTGATVANLLNTTNFADGDQLKAFINGAYAMWTFKEGKWTSGTTVLAEGLRSAPNADTTPLARGSAVWVTTAGKVVAFGAYDSTAVEPEVTTGYNLIGNPMMEAITPAAKTVGDVLIPVGGTELVRYKVIDKGNGAKAWQCHKSVQVSIPSLGISGSQEQTSEEDPTVPVGGSVWLIK